MSSNNPGSPSKVSQVDNNTEEDDEFEEFIAEDWNETEEDQETHLWEDNWDDEDVEDDFSKQLRAEITKDSGNSPMPMKI
ncbi:15414_t:CDS:2 [Rhizophagus irregularis]|nr:15414_t:CDS:2 [Rhizophagus irregularis]